MVRSPNPTFQESFTPDGNGNIAGYTQSVSGTTTVDQTRSANSTNEIATLTNTVGDTVAPEYDAAGNETQTPSPRSTPRGAGHPGERLEQRHARDRHWR